MTYWKDPIYCRHQHVRLTSPPLPSFTRKSAIKKVRLAEDGWNSRDAEKSRLLISWIPGGVIAQNLRLTVRKLKVSLPANGKKNWIIVLSKNSGPWAKIVSQCVTPTNGMMIQVTGSVLTVMKTGNLKIMVWCIGVLPASIICRLKEVNVSSTGHWDVDQTLILVSVNWVCESDYLPVKSPMTVLIGGFLSMARRHNFRQLNSIRYNRKLY